MSTPETLAAWTLAAMVEHELLALEVGSGHNFAGARRPLSAVERAATTRFGDLAALVDRATEAGRPLVRRMMQAGAQVVLTHVFPQGAEAVAADAARQLTELSASVVTRAGAAVGEVLPQVRESLSTIWAAGGEMVVEELGRQGTPGIAGWVVPQAPAVMENLAETITTHPLLRQLERASRYVNDPARALAGRVTREALEELLGDTSEGASVDVLRQGHTALLSMSRWSTVLANGGQFLEAYASAVLDGNACGPCRDTDGKRYESLDEAIADFPLGGNIDCRGGARCRCLIVWIYTPPGASSSSPQVSAG